MTEATKYVAGDFYRICDRTGFKVRASRTKKQWNGYIVRKESWEARHPQDFVKGVADHMAVPEPRPRPHTNYIKTSVLLQSAPVFVPPGVTYASLHEFFTLYGPPIYLAKHNASTDLGGYIYRAEGLGPNEVPYVVASEYPRSW